MCVIIILSFSSSLISFQSTMAESPLHNIEALAVLLPQSFDKRALRGFTKALLLMHGDLGARGVFISYCKYQLMSQKQLAPINLRPLPAATTA
jgi:hypothetical protein